LQAVVSQKKQGTVAQGVYASVSGSLQHSFQHWTGDAICLPGLTAEFAVDFPHGDLHRLTLRRVFKVAELVDDADGAGFSSDGAALDTDVGDTL